MGVSTLKFPKKGEIFANVRELVATNCQMTLKLMEDKRYLPEDNPSCFSRNLWKRNIFRCQFYTVSWMN